MRGVGRLSSCHVSHHARLLVPLSEFTRGAASSGEALRCLFFDVFVFVSIENFEGSEREKPRLRGFACAAAGVCGCLVFRVALLYCGDCAPTVLVVDAAAVFVGLLDTNASDDCGCLGRV